MSQPRLRVFAGPNGSGKTTLFKEFVKKYSPGHSLNADDFEKDLSLKGFVDLDQFKVHLNQENLDTFLKTPRAQSLLAKAKERGHTIEIAIRENLIVDNSTEGHQYEGALISAFLRSILMDRKDDFCFETVMSFPGKVDEIIEAKKAGYKTYLYFICIDDPSVNITRVENRVEQGGHNVDRSIIEKRYPNTLANLPRAIEASDKSYFFDNSDTHYRRIATIKEDQSLELLVDPEELPVWFIDTVLPLYGI